jgi:TetR/AcrR family transcriptional repressor of nem operon
MMIARMFPPIGYYVANDTELTWSARLVNEFFIVCYRYAKIADMARKREFDYDQAIERATRLFWRKGYSNTSLRDLLKVMGVGEGSFYNTVKSKEHLFLLCLKHYNDTVSRRRLNALFSEPSVKKGIRAFFRMVLDELDDPTTPRVCLLAGSLSSDVLDARDLGRYVVGEMQTFTRGFIERLQAAKASGELSEDFDSEVAAQVLVTYLQGLFRVIRVLHDRKQVEKQIDSLLAGLGLNDGGLAPPERRAGTKSQQTSHSSRVVL